jgi:tetratricopeptide (TPR) repeat protein
MRKLQRIGAALLLLAAVFPHGTLEPRLVAGPQTDLSAMEAALAKDPNSLRLGNDYRQAIIRTGDYDRCLKFFETLVADHTDSANAHLNFAFAYVDKIPSAGSITQVILANNALTQFSKTLELATSWIAYYSRGNSYLYWPRIFGRTPSAIADLEQAMKLQKAAPKRSYHLRTFLALGDAYWKMDEPDKAKTVWQEGLREFPGNVPLTVRLATQGDELKAVIDDAYDVSKRVDTSLDELWANQ